MAQKATGAGHRPAPAALFGIRSTAAVSRGLAIETAFDQLGQEPVGAI